MTKLKNLWILRKLLKNPIKTMKNLAYEVQLQGEMESRLCYLAKS